MNVIFLDFDGALSGIHDEKDKYVNGKRVFSDKVEKRIAILADICKKYECKIVIESSAKDAIDEETNEVDPEAEWVNYVFSLFVKYGIECIGRTPNVQVKTGPCSFIPMWKDLEIRKYLFRHPEIDHYCILDDNDTETLFHWKRSDLEKVKEHLVQTCFYNPYNPDLEGLQEAQEKDIARALQLDNEVQKFAFKKRVIDIE